MMEKLIMQDKDRFSPNQRLNTACMLGQLTAVQELVAGGAEVNNFFKQQTPLTACCNSGYLRIAEFLLDAGALPDVPQCDGQTPVQVSENEK